jgi:hypothetical protein
VIRKTFFMGWVIAAVSHRGTAPEVGDPDRGRE